MAPITAREPDRYGVVGYPIKHSKSPLIHGMFAAATGESMSYDRHEVSTEDFTHYLREFFDSGGCGLNVTVPHKEDAARFADELTPRAALAGAVNTLSRLTDGRIRGDNTDGAGLLADLDRLGVPVSGQRVLILGAGGATRGILAPLLERRPAEILIANRSAARAQALAAEAAQPGVRGCSYATLNDSYAAQSDTIAPRAESARAFDLVLHATPLGLEGKLPEVTPRIVGPCTFAYDLGYGTPDTPFVRWAAAHGARATATGIGMLIEQAAEAFFVWRRRRPDTTPVHAALGGSTTQSVSSERENKP